MIIVPPSLIKAMQESFYISKPNSNSDFEPFEDSIRLIENAKLSFFEMIREEQQSAIRNIPKPLNSKP